MEGSPPDWLALPKEMWEDIGQWLPAPAYHHLSAVCQELRDIVGRFPCLTVGVDPEDWEEAKMQSFRLWLEKQHGCVRELRLRIQSDDAWSAVEDLVGRYVFPRLAVAFETGTEESVRRFLTDTQALPNLVDLSIELDMTLTTDASDAALVLNAMSKFPFLERLVVRLGELPDAPFELSGLFPRRLRHLEFDDTKAVLSRTLLPHLPPTLRVLSLSLQADMVPDLPPLPNLETCFLSGSLDYADFLLFLQHVPALAALPGPETDRPVEVNGLHLLELPRSIRTAALWVTGFDLMGDAASFWRNDLDSLDLRVDEVSELVVPEALASMPLRSLEIYCAGSIALPDLAASSLTSLKLFCESATLQRVPPQCRVSFEFLPGPDPDFEMEEDESDEDDEPDDQEDSSSDSDTDGASDASEDSEELDFTP